MARLIDADALRTQFDDIPPFVGMTGGCVQQFIDKAPTVDAVEVPKTGIGDLSDGYHTFNGLYYQRMILFASLVKIHSASAWKSYRHEDGELCFGGGWFIVGIDTPDGSYTYHYESKYFDLFDCVELPAGKHWDGHTEDDVTRLLSLQATGAVEVVHGRWIYEEDTVMRWTTKAICSACKCVVAQNLELSHEYGRENHNKRNKYCPNCGAKMDGSADNEID